MSPLLLDTLGEIYDHIRPRLETVDYLEKQDIDINTVVGFCGSPTVLPIMLLPGRRFDLPDGHGGDTVTGCAIEARDEIGETAIDLVAWPVANPTDVHSLCGAAPILGLWAAHNPSTYIFGRPLEIHQTPLAWLQADCDGAAIIVPQLAGRLLIDLPGPFGGQDNAHVHALRNMVRAPGERVDFLVPSPVRRAA